MSLADAPESDCAMSGADDHQPLAVCNVLIVEDDPADLYVLRRLLRRSSGTAFRTIHAATVSEAVKILATERVDVALIDYFIGGQLGTEVIEQLDRDRIVPAIMLTGKDFSNQDRELIHDGAFDFLDKNELTLSALARSIDFAINRSRIETNLRITEERLRAVREEAQELRRAYEEADRANKVKSDFLAHMSHELRTPLNAILGYSEVIRDDVFAIGINPRYCDYASAVHSSGQHLLTLIDDLLDLSKIEAGCQALEIEEIDISHALDEVMTLLAPIASNREVHIRRDLQAGMREVQADLRALKQILVNLVSNAIKFSQMGASITIKMRETVEESIITIIDTGAGIPEQEIMVALTPFRQTGRADLADSKGTGLGLPISKLLVEEHGGSLTLSSTLGKGTSVTLRFPKEDQGRVGWKKRMPAKQSVSKNRKQVA